MILRLKTQKQVGTKITLKQTFEEFANERVNY